MAALIGTRSVMEAAQKTFISSTYWTEKIGPVAALATIRKMIAHNVPEHLNRTGISVRKIWRDNARKYGIKAMIHGIPPLSILSFKYKEMSQALHTLFTQEMLNRGFLASKAFYATYAHNEEHLKAYEEAVKEVFEIIAETINESNMEDWLQGPVAHNGFKRLA